MDTTGYAEASSSGGGIGAALVGLVYLAVIVLFIASMWRVYTKAGQPGWSVIIPIYGQYVQTQIVGRPAWWVVLYFIPVVNFVVGLIMTVDLAKSFGKGVGFALGMIFLPFIFIPMLGFGSATYQGPSAAETAAPARG